MSERLDRWMHGYIAAWRSNDPEQIAALFSDDAVYDPQTKSGAWSGNKAIVQGWIDVGDQPGTWAFEWSPLIESGDTSIITGRTVYTDAESPRAYRNLWVIEFDTDGLCRRFVEWYVRDHGGE